MTNADAPDYTFGDTALAGDRLALLAAVFEPSTAELLREAPAHPRLALDLGCGPGVTTRLVHRTTGAGRTVGLDSSPAFVARASLDAPSGVDFFQHDVTKTPFPVTGPDLIFCRYLLAHLPDPLEVAGRWARSLAPHGRLLVEEIETIDTDQPDFGVYLDIVTRMMASRGGHLYIGRELGNAPLPPLDATLSRRQQIAPSSGVAARLFSMNLDTWRRDPWVVANVESSTVERLAAVLTERRDDDAVGEIVWTHRQVVYEQDSGE